MNMFFSILMTFLSFTDINGQCSTNYTNVKVTECDVSIRAEHRVFVNFFQHNISCNCTVTSLFDGELHINFTQTEYGNKCYHYSPYTVKVNDTVIKNCYGEGHAMFNVQTNDIVSIKVGYIENYYPMKITPCLEVYGLDNGSIGDISLTCGNPAEPTTSTTTIIESSRTYIVSSEANYYNNNDDVETINSLVTTSSVDSTFKESSNADSDKQICEFSQIPLGIFIAITIVSAILNVFFFYRRKSRNPFGTYSNNRNTVTNKTTGHRNQIEAYSELNVGDIARGGTTDAENQYDALKHHDNYINMTCIGDKGGAKTSECTDCYININHDGNMATK